MMLNQAATLLSSVCAQVGNLHDPFAQKADCSHFALTVLFQSDSIGLSRRRALRARSNVSVLRCPNGGQCTDDLSG
jgi:hypothetical protein